MFRTISRTLAPLLLMLGASLPAAAIPALSFAPLDNTDPITGSATTASGTTTLSQSKGEGAEDNAIEATLFDYDYLTGNGSLSAYVTTTAYNSAGLMLRSSLAPLASSALVGFEPFPNPNYGVSYESGRTQSSGTVSTSGGNLTPANPGFWVQLTRVGNTVTLQRSQTDGNWYTDEVLSFPSLPNTVDLGLYMLGQTGSTATFSDVSFSSIDSGTFTVPAPKSVGLFALAFCALIAVPRRIRRRVLV